MIEAGAILLTEMNACGSACYPLWLMPLAFVGSGLVVALFTRRWVMVPVAAAAGVALIVAVETTWRVVTWNDPPSIILDLLFERATLWKDYAFLFVALHVVIAFFMGVKRALTWSALSSAPALARVAVGGAVVLVVASLAFALGYRTAPEVLPRRIVERTADVLGETPKRCDRESATPVTSVPVFHGLPPERSDARGGGVGVPRAYEALPEVRSTVVGYVDHLLSWRVPIRVPEPRRYAPLQGVSMTVVVSERGEVLAVAPEAGPEELYEQAIAIASQWRFMPFVRDGNAVAVRLTRAVIGIEGPALWRDQPVTMPAYGDPQSLLIKLDAAVAGRRYKLEIRGDSSVTFEGFGAAALTGMHCGRIAPASLDALVREVGRTAFFSMRDSYAMEKDSVVVTVALDDHVREVQARPEADRGDETPASLWRLVDAILLSVDAERWIKGNPRTRESLVAERWDFSRTDDDNAWMLAKVAANADPDVVRDLIAHGAPIATSSGPWVWLRQSAIEAAAGRGRSETVRELLSTGAAWGQSALDRAYLSVLEHGDTDTANLLLTHGARLDARDDAGRNAVVAAARTGRPDLVEQALKARLELDPPGARLSALHVAAGAGLPIDVESIHADRRRMIDMLINAGAEVERRDYWQRTPLNSNWLGYEDVTAALIARGANVNTRDDSGRTPLMTTNGAAAVQLLLEAGADIYARDDSGRSALDITRADVTAAPVVRVLEAWMAAHPPPAAE